MNKGNISVYDRYQTNVEFRMKFLDVAALCHLWITPLLLLTGLIGNSISFLVWTHPRIRRNNSSATYLSALSLSDLLLLLTHLIHYLKFAWRMRVFDYPGICEIFQMSYLIFQYNSSPLVLAFTLERWIAVCYPFKRESWCTPKRAYMAISLILVIMLGIGLVQAFGWTANNEKVVCIFRESWQNSMLVYVFSATVEFLMSGGVPICTLVFNILVIHELRSIVLNPLKQDLKSIKNRKQIDKIIRKDDKKNISLTINDITADEKIKDEAALISNIPEDVQTSRYKTVNITPQMQRVQTSGGVNFRSTTIMLLTVSFYQIFTTLPSGAVYVSQFFILDGDQYLTDIEINNDSQWKTFFRHQTIKEFLDLFSLTHYCFNVLIYLLTGRQFRKYLLQILKFDKCLINRDNNVTCKYASNMRSSTYGQCSNTVIPNLKNKKAPNCHSM